MINGGSAFWMQVRHFERVLKGCIDWLKFERTALWACWNVSMETTQTSQTSVLLIGLRDFLTEALATIQTKSGSKSWRTCAGCGQRNYWHGISRSFELLHLSRLSLLVKTQWCLDWACETVCLYLLWCVVWDKQSSHDLKSVTLAATDPNAALFQLWAMAICGVWESVWPERSNMVKHHLRIS